MATVKIECFIEEQDIREFIYHSPNGPVPGYQWRLLLCFPATIMEAEKTAWTPWVFGSCPSVEKMLEQWRAFLEIDGHLAKQAPPGTSVQ